MEKRPSTLKRYTFREEVKNYLADVILRGEYKAGDRIVETKIAKILGISQAPVREAIRELEQMGLLETKPYRGTYVRKFSLEDLKNVYVVRAELESLAIGYAMKNMGSEDIARLKEILERMVYFAEENNSRDYVKTDMTFHREIISASRNNILQKAWESISLPYWTYFGVYQVGWGLKKLALRHNLIIEALSDGNVRSARKVMREHFYELKEFLEKNKKTEVRGSKNKKGG